MKEKFRQKMINIYVRHKLSIISIPFWIVCGLILSSHLTYWIIACLCVIFGYIVEGEGVKRGIGQGLWSGYCEGVRYEKQKQEDEKKRQEDEKKQEEDE